MKLNNNKNLVDIYVHFKTKGYNEVFFFLKNVYYSEKNVFRCMFKVRGNLRLRNF